ncbi:hypothetical protein [Thermosipho sp. (in: thermotogales)]|jgi:DNA ligase-1|uniref:ATP-dependent DNA ligase n=1 Tax=Thermosipho sp. (in: thermotogales) TaxID=1968895 RepID=UPI00257F8E7C|nr:hypothetical protein [Thermosipho sp. (in: thermotogales)]MBZ4649281.1 hypothetical protein [Thermosipho sp. (in: thermotogales)]
MVKDDLIKEAFNALEELGKTNSTKVKAEILRSYKSNEYLKQMLKLSLDPYLTFGIKKLPECTVKSSKISAKKFDELSDMLTRLANRELTGNAARNAVEKFLSNCSAEEYYWYSQVISKDLNVGIGDKTVNKVFKDLIPQFNVALAEPFKKAVSIPSKVIIEDKIDGIRCIAVKYSRDDIILYSRNGKELFGFDYLIEEIKKIPEDEIVLDGELISGKNFNDTSAARGKKVRGKEAIYNIFDMIDVTSFKEGIDETPILKRKKNLIKTVKETDILKIVKFSDPIDPEDKKKLDFYFEDALSRGFEGIMLKGYDSEYECKRTNKWLKLKPEETYDGKVKGFQEGTGMFEGTLGAILVEFKGNIVKVGSGFSVEQRNEIWKNRKKYLNKTIEFKGQEVTENKRGTHSVRFPVFVRFREDK